MTYFQLATVSVNQTALDWNGNRDRIQNALTDILERTPGDNRALPDCILFPELCVSGYGCEDAFHSEDVARRSWDALEEIADHSRALTRTTLIFLGLPVRLADRVYNCMAAVYDGRVIGIVPKANLAGDGVHYEPRWFSDYRESGQQQVRRTDREIPLGPLLFDHNGVRISLEICEDAWVAARPSLAHLARGVEIVLNPGASHFALGKYNIRRHIALESSRALLTVFAQVNLLGCEAGRMIYDGSSIVASAGEILYENRGFSFADFITNEVTLDLGKNRALRSRIYSHKKQETPSATEQDRSNPILIVTGSATRQSIGFSDDSMPVKSRTSHPAAMHTYASRSVDDAAHLSREMEFLHAVTLGLFDYLRRSRSRGFVISLSGGADSASCALLIQRMLAFAVHELGIQETLRRLGRPELTQKLKIEDDSVLAVGQRLKLATDALTGEFLHTVYQATDQSSETTRSAAATIAAEFNSHHNEVDVQELVNAYNARIESILKRN
ncbi:MAG: hypothetical protein KDK27_03820, partial [Leptospiraceae bacterium]|nr:hypothetical protein [Leptospiraceae bacterium]